MTREDLRQRVAEIVHHAASGAISVTDALTAGASLHELGLDSVGWLRLIDALDMAYGVELDLTDTRLGMTTIDVIADRVMRELDRDGPVVA